MGSLLSVAPASPPLPAVSSTAPASSVDAPTGHLGATLRLQATGIVAGVTVAGRVVLINPHTDERLTQWNP
ncbi:Uncharacterised protein [Mycolicibacterium aichiense]|nr:Uncharacterised protein [Mycolicibacterium aichiense]